MLDMTLPQLIKDDVQQLEEVLREFLERTDATTVLLIDKGGFLIMHQGEATQFDLTTLGALASGAFMANQTIAGLVSETNFNSIYQQGENFSMFVVNVDEHCLLMVIFKAQMGVGVVKYFAANAVERIARQIQTARERDPHSGLDLSMLNLADTQHVFRKKGSKGT
jgi:predicted regulator of Ras-like GTPase activity (Roadblock/LC7/MglB family)